MRGTVILAAALAGVVAGGALVYRGVAAQDNSSVSSAANGPVEIATGIVETPACTLEPAEFDALEAATRGDVAAMRPAERGLSLANLPITAPDGSPTTLGEASPGLTLLNLWATWCAPCRAEMPGLAELRRNEGAPGQGGGEDGFDVLALNVDTPSADPAAFLAEIGVDLPLYTDPTLRTFTNLRDVDLAAGLPVTALVDAEGCVLASMNGPAEWWSEDARELIEVARGL